MDPHVPTEETRQSVEKLAALGLSQDLICGYIGLGSTNTLAKYYRDEIDRGKARAIAKVASVAFELASSGTCPAMTMFFLKTQARWREVNRVEHAVDEGAGIVVQIVNPNGTRDTTSTDTAAIPSAE